MTTNHTDLIARLRNGPPYEENAHWLIDVAKAEALCDEAADALEALQPAEPSPREKRYAEALEPFATFADTFIDAEGWVSPMRSERIIDWFGPSDFRHARTALAEKEGDRG